MAGNNSVQILRGTRAQIANSSQTLAPGQPLYNTDDGYLTVGSATNGAPGSLDNIVKSREIVGYVADTQLGEISQTQAYMYQVSHTDGVHDLEGIEYTDDEQKVYKIRYFDGTGVYTQSNIRDGRGVRSIEQSTYYNNTKKGCYAEGKYSVALNQSTIAHQIGSMAVGGASQAGRTEEEFNNFYYDAQSDSFINGGSTDGKGNILDHTGTAYAKSGSFSFSSGNKTKARGYGSFVGGGRESVADGLYSGIIGGTLNEVSGSDSTIIGGTKNKVTGARSTVIGGTENTVTGYGSGAFGNNNAVTGNNSFAFGNHHVVDTNNRFVIGKYSRNDSALFTVGNGDANQVSNALAVYSDGTVLVDKFATQSHEVVNLETLRKMGTLSNILGDTAQNSVVGGRQSANNAPNSLIFGYGLLNNSQKEGSAAFGYYNETSNDMMFAIGVGTGSSSSQRANAFEVHFNGKVFIPKEQSASDKRSAVRQDDLVNGRMLPLKGVSTAAGGDNSVEHIASAGAYAENSVALGYNAQVNKAHVNSIAIGRNAITTTSNQVVIGPFSAKGSYANVILGCGRTDGGTTQTKNGVELFFDTMKIFGDDFVVKSGERKIDVGVPMYHQGKKILDEAEVANLMESIFLGGTW